MKPKTYWRNRAAYYEGCAKLSILGKTIEIVLQSGEDPETMFKRVFHSSTRAYGINDLVLFRRAFESRRMRNRAKCRLCSDVIESLTPHDFKRCKCGAIGVDGGQDYRRRIGERKHIEEMP